MFVLLIDDDQLFTSMISEYLEGEGIRCECVSDPLQGLARALSREHDAVILDVMMPGMDGLELLREIRRKSGVPILMLTAKGDDVDRVIGLEIGADDYLAKPVYSRELVARLKAVLRRGKAAFEPEAAEAEEISVGPLSIFARRRECQLQGVPLSLTVSEFDVLHELARHAGNVVSKDDLSLKALRRPRPSYDRSIDIHISNMRQKLKPASDRIEIETVRGFGYRLRTIP